MNEDPFNYKGSFISLLSLVYQCHLPNLDIINLFQLHIVTIILRNLNCNY